MSPDGLLVWERLFYHQDRAYVRYFKFSVDDIIATRRLFNKLRCGR